MPQSFPDHLIAFLKNPGSYPHNPGQVEHIQTHISHVFIAPPFVYKFKKPVNFDFLDFSTPEKRKYFCEREVELNRRLCEGLYLGVTQVFLENGSWSFESTNSALQVEYAVKMNLLEKKNFLIHTVKEGKLSKEHLDRVINKLIPFYRSQTPDEKILKWGKPKKIKVNTDENFKQTKPFIGDTIPKHTYYAIRTYTQRFLDENRELFLKRIDKKRIVDGHGDLHLEHIYMTDDHVCIYDCIEFNERFRYQDITSDISFLAMDLDFNNLRNEARYFVEEMSAKLHDPDIKQLIDFYKCYRSYVRGKVKSLQSSEEEVSLSDRTHAAGLAGRYFQLSLSYALFGSKPTVLIFMGRVGSGKSTLSRQLAEEVGLHYSASDITRKKMGGIPLSKRTPLSKRNQLYSDEMSDRTYEELIETAKTEILNGKSLILDATFSDPSYRNQLLLLLKNIEAEYYFIETEAPAVVRKKRLENRKQDSTVISDARHEDFEMLDSRYDPPSEINPRHLIRINTDKSKEESIQQLFQKLVNIQLS
ncbi:MAG: AAA family ATPase [Balneolaceae bacterium]